MVHFVVLFCFFFLYFFLNYYNYLLFVVRQIFIFFEIWLFLFYLFVFFSPSIRMYCHIYSFFCVLCLFHVFIEIVYIYMQLMFHLVLFVEIFLVWKVIAIVSCHIHPLMDKYTDMLSLSLKTMKQYLMNFALWSISWVVWMILICTFLFSVPFRFSIFDMYLTVICFLCFSLVYTPHFSAKTSLTYNPLHINKLIKCV